MAELADAADSKSADLRVMGVRPPSRHHLQFQVFVVPLELPYAPSAFRIAPAMFSASRFIFSSDSASIITRASASVPE